MSLKTRTLLGRILIFLAVIALSIYILSLSATQAMQLAKYGYPGIFLLSILSNATLILPAPGFLLVLVMGAVLNPFWVAIVAGIGAAIGELTGYLVGYSGRAVIEQRETYERITSWMRKNSLYSYLLITLLAFIPNPFFDLAGIAAGSLKIPVMAYLLFCAIGKIAKMLMIAYAGGKSLNWLMDLFIR